MSEKSELISKLINRKNSRRAYAKSHLIVNIPSQIRALRRRRDMSQKALAKEAEMMQPRISAMERPGETNYNIETLVRLASAFKVALLVKFVSFSDLLKWENEFSQDTFNVTKIDDDLEFQQEEAEQPAQVTAGAMPMSVLQPQPQNVVVPELRIITGTGLATDTSAALGIGGKSQSDKPREGLRNTLSRHTSPFGEDPRWTLQQ